jgi:ABC-2 type transport system ATP-binding protein
MAILTFSHLRKTYATTIASDDVSFEVRPGEVFGLLGPNGAGKSTLIRMLMNIIVPDGGEILLDGRPLTPQDRDRIGYLPEERGLYRKEKVLDVLIYFGMLKGMARSLARERSLAWLERIALKEMADRRVDQMSKGQQQKVQIAGALLHDPSIIVVDEPFTGLDPINTVLVREILLERRRAGAIVVLSTHQMLLVEALCDRVAMIHRGRLVLYGELEEIRRREREVSVLVGAEEALPPLSLVARAEAQGPRTRLFLQPGVPPRDLMALLLRQGVTLTHFEVVRTPVEEIFVRTVREQEPGVDLSPAATGRSTGAAAAGPA